MKMQKKKSRMVGLLLLSFILIFSSTVIVSAGTIIASDHWTLTPIYDIDHLYYSLYH